MVDVIGLPPRCSEEAAIVPRVVVVVGSVLGVAVVTISAVEAGTADLNI